MADDQATAEQTSLKYLGFVRYAVVKVTVFVVSLYEVAKENSGPLKPGVDSVEGTVKTVVGPVYQKIEGKPDELLLFVDGKVDAAVQLLDDHLPPTVKARSVEVVEVAKGTPEFARSVWGEVQKNGLYGTAHSYYSKYEPVAEAYGIKAWKLFVSLPLVQPAVGLVRQGAAKFNSLVVTLKDHQIPLVGYVPLIPLSYIDTAMKTD